MFLSRMIVLFLVALPLLADSKRAVDLDKLVAQFEKERNLPYRERIATLNRFSRIKSEHCLSTLQRLYRKEKDRLMTTVRRAARGGGTGTGRAVIRL